MKTYRYTNLLPIFITLVAGFATTSDQVRPLFDTPKTEITQQQTADPLSSSHPSPNTDTTKAAPKTLEQGTTQPITLNPQLGSTRTAQPQKQSACINYYGYITIGAKNICLASTGTTGGQLSYNHAYVYNNINSQDKFIFGHNSASIFGNLKNQPVGTTFSVTIHNQTTNYRIIATETTCDYSNNYKCEETYPNDPILNMNHAIIPSLREADLSIMTCAGTALPNGDATHRLLIYAAKI